MVNFFEILNIFVCFVVAIFDLVHDVEAIHDLCYLLTASGNPFCNVSDACVSRVSLIFQKRFPDAVSS